MRCLKNPAQPYPAEHKSSIGWKFSVWLWCHNFELLECVAVSFKIETRFYCVGGALASFELLVLFLVTKMSCSTQRRPLSVNPGARIHLYLLEATEHRTKLRARLTRTQVWVWF